MGGQDSLANNWRECNMVDTRNLSPSQLIRTIRCPLPILPLDNLETETYLRKMKNGIGRHATLQIF